MDRSEVLGVADVSEESLGAIVADALGWPGAQILECSAERAEYDLEALTTAGRYWVSGRAAYDGAEARYAFFVKVVQSWSRSPHFAFVPEHVREFAAANYPWRSEPAVYRSDLRDRLPRGLSMPQAHAVIDLDEQSAALWLDALDVVPVCWDVGRLTRIAYLLGRLAASPAIQPMASLGKADVVRSYFRGRLTHQILPALGNPAMWSHPLVAPTFGPLHERLTGTLDRLPELVEELAALPVGVAHGDACTRNVLVTADHPDEYTLIDFGFWCAAPFTFDLTQLLVGEIQTGERPAAELDALDEPCLTAYHRGLVDEGATAALHQLRRAHALHMLIFFAASAVPFDKLNEPVTAERLAVASERAAAAAFVLDLVDATDGQPTPHGRD